MQNHMMKTLFKKSSAFGKCVSSLKFVCVCVCVCVCVYSGSTRKRTAVWAFGACSRVSAAEGRGRWRFRLLKSQCV